MQIKATNQYGNYSTYTLNGPGVALISVTGLNPPPADISTSPIATKDGSIFTNAQVQDRNIVLTFAITGVKPETQRTSIYYIFKVKEPISLEIKTSTRTAYIDGYVKNINADPFNQKQQIQVSIICPEPYFLGSEESRAITYPSTNVVTLSDCTHGAVFEITATGSITGGFTIGNTLTGQQFKVNGDYQTGDVITLDTRLGLKALTLTRNGTTTNILQQMDSTLHDWIQLVPYDNNEITLSSLNLSAVCKYQTHYEGV